MHAPVPRGCECGCRHTGAPDALHQDVANAPLAYLVEREGEGQIRICTCCLHDEDEVLQLLASFEMDPRIYSEYDHFGTLLLSLRLHAAAGLEDDYRL